MNQQYIDSALQRTLERLSDAELREQVSNAWSAAYLESYGHDYAAHADAIQEYEMLNRELQRRKKPDQTLADFLNGE
jgi:hypothetical protein